MGKKRCVERPQLLGCRKGGENLYCNLVETRDQLGLQVSAMVKLSADWEVKVESLHTGSHSAHLLA